MGVIPLPPAIIPTYVALRTARLKKEEHTLSRTVRKTRKPTHLQEHLFWVACIQPNEQLNHRNSKSSQKQSYLKYTMAFVCDLAFWTPEEQRIANFQRFHVLRHFPTLRELGVGFLEVHL
jgi:hypothetical protein